MSILNALLGKQVLMKNELRKQQKKLKIELISIV